MNDPLRAAGVLDIPHRKDPRIHRGNKRTVLLLARWVLDNNQLDGSRIIDVNKVSSLAPELLI
ncbi:hypothetical protein BH23ACT5_BH23ACT5_21590 [soil metagenome]